MTDAVETKFYIGAVLLSTEWTWESDGKVVTSFNWGQGEPNGANHVPPETCVFLHPEWQFAWMDVACTIAAGAICERSISL